MVVVFRQESTNPPLYDLIVDGRARAYDVEPEDFQAALKRARLKSDEMARGVFVEDTTGYRQPLGR